MKKFICFDGNTFTNEADLIKWIRSRGGSEGLSDEFILNEAYNLEEYTIEENNKTL